MSKCILMSSIIKYGIYIVICIFAVVVFSYVYMGSREVEKNVVLEEDDKGVEATSVQSVIINESVAISVPLDRGNERITKKSFGAFITPENSPVQPERFRGYHTGTDFEILEGEESEEIVVRAICDGPIKEKRFINGYGGVVVQECVIDDVSASVIYGHLRLEDALDSGTVVYGDEIGVLGKGYSEETSGERKHLHLGIYKSKNIDVRGYASRESELENWIDPCRVIDCAL